MADRESRPGPAPQEGPTVSQLRDDIDSGRTGDKVAADDPAAAPLGTDEEAAGTPPAPDAVAAARRIETGRPVTRRKEAPPPLWLRILLGVLALSLIGALIMLATMR